MLTEVIWLTSPSLPMSCQRFNKVFLNDHSQINLYEIQCRITGTAHNFTKSYKFCPYKAGHSCTHLQRYSFNYIQQTQAVVRKAGRKYRNTARRTDWLLSCRAHLASTPPSERHWAPAAVAASLSNGLHTDRLALSTHSYSTGASRQCFCSSVFQICCILHTTQHRRHTPFCASQPRRSASSWLIIVGTAW